MTKYERLVIQPILDVIEKHQKYLTQPENLPQLAKIGYIYNKMYYAGRVAYGYDGIVKKGNSCENNPKDWLENVNYLNEKIDYLVYDAWGMHISNDGNVLNFDDIKSLVFEDEIFKICKIKNINYILLESEKSAIGFWEKMGFKIKDQNNNILMKKEIICI